MTNVLVIDDEKSIRATLSTFLKARGYGVWVAEHANAALQILQTSSVDIVLCDIVLPDITGVEILKRIGEIAPDVLVVMMTGAPTLDTATESLRAGAFDYLVKPLAIDTIYRIVERAAHLKSLTDEKKRLEEENRHYQTELEELVRNRTGELLKSREQLKAVFESSGDRIMLLDKTHRVVMVNRNNENATVDDMIGKPLYELMDASDRDRVKEHLDRVLAHNTKEQFETTYRRPDASTVYLSSVAAPVVVSGSVSGCVVSSRDVTERRHLQSQLAQSDRLASMGMLAAGVAHEINNPLAYILFNLESLHDDLPRILEACGLHTGGAIASLGDGTEATIAERAGAEIDPSLLADVRDRLHDALEGTKRIRSIARSLGTFSRVERDDLAPVDLSHVLEVATNMAMNEIKYRARLVKNYGKVPLVMASDGRLSQVFLNLVINAAHAIGEGDVENNEIRLRTWTESNAVCAEVVDTGTGIAPENLDKIFEPFFSTKKSGLGSGLGLPISKSIVEGYGGTIVVESKQGEGTRFVIRFPRRHVAQPVVSCHPDPASSLSSRGRILIVDDESAIRSAMVRMLREHKVIDVANGTEAKNLLTVDAQFDLILCDVMMSNMSGIDLHEWLTSAHPRLAEQFIFITGGAFTPRAREYLNNVDNYIIERPFNVTNFRRLVHDLVVRSQKGPIGDL